MKIKLDGVSETLLITLWAKAMETKRKDAIIRDEKSIDIINSIDYDFKKFRKYKASEISIIIRTKIIDEALGSLLKSFMDKNEKVTVINMGAGLDTRFSRFLNDNVYWYDIDLPEVISLRKNFFAENDNYKMIAKSILDFSWIKNIDKKTSSFIFIAEGLMMYLEESEIRETFQKIHENFQKANMLFDTSSSFFTKNSVIRKHLKKTLVVFKWHLDKPKDIENIYNHVKYIESWKYTDYYKRRWGIFILFMYLPVVRNIFNFNVVHIEFVR